MGTKSGDVRTASYQQESFLKRTPRRTECVASLNIQNMCFSYKYFSIFVGKIVHVFSQSDVRRQQRATERNQ